MVASKASFSETDLKLLDDILVNNSNSINFAFIDVDWNEQIGFEKVVKIVEEQGDVHFAIAKMIFIMLRVNPELKGALLKGLELYEGDVK